MISSAKQTASATDGRLQTTIGAKTLGKSIDDGASPMVSIEGVEKWFSDVPVLRGIDLQVGVGSTVALLGRSGSGKTTLLRCVNGLEVVSGGRLVVDGCVVQDAGSGAGAGRLDGSRLRQLRTRVGIVFQQYNLFPHMSAVANVDVAQRLVRGRSAAEAHDVSMSLLGKVGLEHVAHSRPSQLSGGQQQRVAIARALAMDPVLLLLDEVTSALDPQMTMEVLRVIKELAIEGLTMLVVTHEMGFAKNIADRVVLMVDGKIVEDAPPAKFFSRPENEKSREFLSSMLELS